MDQYLLIIKFFLVFIFANAQTVNNTSAVNQPWFWPTVSISLALLITIPSVLTILIYLYVNKHKSNDDSDLTSSHSTSAMSEQQQSEHSRHVPGFRSPPPPYPASEQPEHIFVTPSLPPPYESHLHENPSTQNPTESTPAVLDLSTTLISQSIQTFQA